MRWGFFLQINFRSYRSFSLNNHIPLKYFFLFCYLIMFVSQHEHYFFSKYFFRNNNLDMRGSNSLDSDQAPHSVGPDLGLNCSQRLSPEAKFAVSRQRVKYSFRCILIKKRGKKNSSFFFLEIKRPHIIRS